MQISKWIITAMPEEAEKIIKLYNMSEEKIIWALKIYSGMRKSDNNEDEKIYVFLCGVGKIYSAFATTYMMENYDLQKIVNIWVVWNLKPESLKIWDVVMPNTFIQHDVYIPDFLDSMSYLRDPIFIEYAIWEEFNLEKFSLHLNGICVTWDQFIDSDDLMTELVEAHSADIVDMEAYSILSVLKNYDALDKVVVIKSVSDGANNDAAKDHTDNLDFAMENAIAILDFTL